MKLAKSVGEARITQLCNMSLEEDDLKFFGNEIYLT